VGGTREFIFLAASRGDTRPGRRPSVVRALFRRSRRRRRSLTVTSAVSRASLRDGREGNRGSGVEGLSRASDDRRRRERDISDDGHVSLSLSQRRTSRRRRDWIAHTYFPQLAACPLQDQLD